MSVNTSFNVAGPIAQTPAQAIDTLRRSKGLDVVLLVANDGVVHAAWHDGERDSGRFTGWLSSWKEQRERLNARPSINGNALPPLRVRTDFETDRHQ
jgi:carbamoyltransferase